MLRVENIKGVIWDLDGVLHAYRPFDESLAHWNRAAANAFNAVAARREIDHGLSYEQAFAMAEKGFEKNGFSISLLIEEYKLDPVEMLVAFHHATDIAQVMKSHVELPQALRNLSAARPDIIHVLNTHGPYTWAERSVDHHGLREALGNPAIVSLERGNMEKKSDTSRTFHMAVQATGLKPDEMVMVEDTVKNLRIPKQEGAQTAFIAESGLTAEYIQYPCPADDFVDQSFPTAIDFVRALTHG